MNRLRSLDPPPPVVRYEHKHPRDLIHFDIKRLACIVKPDHRVHGDRSKEVRGAGWEHLHIAIDDHTRLAFAARRAYQAVIDGGARGKPAEENSLHSGEKVATSAQTVPAQEAPAKPARGVVLEFAAKMRPNPGREVLLNA